MFAIRCPSGEMVDAVDSKSIVERRAGSSPAWGTITLFASGREWVEITHKISYICGVALR